MQCPPSPPPSQPRVGGWAKLTAGRPPVSEKRKDMIRKRDTRGHRGENKQERTRAGLPAAAKPPDSGPRRRRLGSPTWTTRKHLDWPQCHVFILILEPRERARGGSNSWSQILAPKQTKILFRALFSAVNPRRGGSSEEGHRETLGLREPARRAKTHPPPLLDSTKASEPSFDEFRTSPFTSLSTPLTHFRRLRSIAVTRPASGQLLTAGTES